VAEPQRCSPYASPSATRAVLEAHGLTAKYTFGQNFLVNDDVIRRILQLSAVGEADGVLEVGPGIGTLTAALLQRGRYVVAVERDADLPPVLADALYPWRERFSLVEKDALQLSAADVEGTLSVLPAAGGAVEEARQAQQHFFQMLYRGIPPQECRAMERMLERLADNLKEGGE